MRGMIFFAPAFLLLSAGLASADPAYTAEEVVDFFVRQKLGGARAICVGTPDECGAAAKAAEPKPFDMLVTFDFNSDRLTEDAKRNLDKFAKALADPRLTSASFEVDGHTDATGSEGYNLNLSERRAEAVVAYLGEKGVDVSKLKPRGFGKTKPRVPDPFDPQNRRVETRLVTR